VYSVSPVRPAPDVVSFDVDGATLGALRWPGRDGAPTVVAVHGITANAWAWGEVAHRLDGDVDLLASDLRGRGRSWTQPAPFGIRQHADDVGDVIEQIGGPVTVVAHSMGTYAALMAARRRADVISSLVLVDGGTPLFLPDPPLGDDDQAVATTEHIDHVLDVSLGPAIERLAQVWPDRAAYAAMWAQHPALVAGISDEVARALSADLVDIDGELRVGVNADAVRVDGRELFADDEVRSELARCRVPTTLIRAELGLMGAPPPLIADEMIGQYPQHRWIRADGLNHYTVMNSDAGALMVADAIRSSLTAVARGG
jgi:lipase